MNTSGGPGTYEPQIVDELVPLIDPHLPTDAQRKTRAIGGISRGGVWSLEIGFCIRTCLASSAGTALH
jgi:enterochelin esterase-like enzyme